MNNRAPYDDAYTVASDYVATLVEDLLRDCETGLVAIVDDPNRVDFVTFSRNYPHGFFAWCGPQPPKMIPFLTLLEHLELARRYTGSRNAGEDEVDEILTDLSDPRIGIEELLAWGNCRPCQSGIPHDVLWRMGLAQMVLRAQSHELENSQKPLLIVAISSASTLESPVTEHIIGRCLHSLSRKSFKVGLIVDKSIFAKKFAAPADVYDGLTCNRFIKRVTDRLQPVKPTSACDIGKPKARTTIAKRYWSWAAWLVWKEMTRRPLLALRVYLVAAAMGLGGQWLLALVVQSQINALINAFITVGLLLFVLVELFPRFVSKSILTINKPPWIVEQAVNRRAISIWANMRGAVAALQATALSFAFGMLASFPINSWRTPDAICWLWNLLMAAITGAIIFLTKASTSVHISVAPTLSTYLDPVTLSASVRSSTKTVPSGAVTFTDRSSGKAWTEFLDDRGMATCTASLEAGTRSIIATYTGDKSFNSSQSAVWHQIVNKIPTSTRAFASAASSTYEDIVTLTVKVSSSTARVPTGKVTLTDAQSGQLFTAMLDDSGIASFQLSLAAGVHDLTASYCGDPCFNASRSAVRSQTVTRASTSIQILASAASSTYGDGVTLTAKVTSSIATMPAGKVTFTDVPSGKTFTALLDNMAIASCQVSLAGGSHAVTAAYSGNMNYNASQSAALQHDVRKAATSVCISPTPEPSAYGQGVTLIARVSSASAAILVGTVTFKIQSKDSRPVPVHAGLASISVGLTAGSHAISAYFSGSTDFASSQSPIHNQIVTPADTVTTLRCAPAELTWHGLKQGIMQILGTILIIWGELPPRRKLRRLIIFTVYVKTLAPSRARASGRVSLKTGLKTLDTAKLDERGKAIFALDQKQIGRAIIMAFYAGDRNCRASDSS